MLSVIVPIYNTAAYLDRCIQSICDQTYQDLEIVLVDDGSTDTSLEICEAYRKKDPRIKLIHKENGGLVSARKAGLQAAEGEWIGWVDSDDWVEADWFMRLLHVQERSGADMVTAGCFHEIGADLKPVTNGVPAGVYQKDELLPKLLYSGRFFEYGLQPHLCTKLIRREILEQTQFSVNERINAGEDAAVVYPSALEADKIAVTEFCGYHYIQRAGALTKTGTADEIERIRLLIAHLEDSFREKRVWDVMRPQLRQYQKYLLFLRQMSELDRSILLPYGGIAYGSRVVIYGAGVSGQKMYRYLTEAHRADVVLWVDRNYRTYQENGLPVDTPEAIKRLKNSYDHIIIANTTQNAADPIRQYLLDLPVPASKIRWFCDGFIDEGWGI